MCNTSSSKRLFTFAGWAFPVREILQLEPFQLMVPPRDYILNLILSTIKIRVLLLSK